MGETDAFLKVEEGGFDAEEGLITAQVQVQVRNRPAPIRPTIIITAWILLSGSMILFNKYIFSTLSFPYPVFLTFNHMLVTSIGTKLLRLVPGRFSQTKLDMPTSLWLRLILPTAVLFSASLILSNVAYVHLNVSFLQTLKAFIPILVLIIQLAAGLQAYNHFLLGVIALTCFGSFVAANGEVPFPFSVSGLMCQTFAVIVESLRLVMIQVMLKTYRMDPLMSLALYAPICVVFIGTAMPIMEGSEPWLCLMERVGVPTLLLNGAVAFALNVAGVLLIDSAGNVVLTLSGVFKDVLLIIFSVTFLGSFITPVQVAGCMIALTGLMLYRFKRGSPESPFGLKIMAALAAGFGVRLGPRMTRTLVALGASIVCAVTGLRFLMITRSLGGIASMDLVSLPVLSGSILSGTETLSLKTQHAPGLDIIGLRDDLYILAFQNVDRLTVTLLTTHDSGGKPLWPLMDEAVIYCRGDRDAEWFAAQRRHDTEDPHGHVLILECPSSGTLLNLELRSPAGIKGFTIPMRSVRRRHFVEPGGGPHLAAWTMVKSWSPKIPLWLEYHLLHGMQEFYIYDNSESGATSEVPAKLAPYIVAGMVTIVPWYKDIIGSFTPRHPNTPPWISQQILSMNHVIRSLDGYADWILMTDLDEFPVLSDPPQNDEPFQYSNILDDAVAADPQIGSLQMLNCFTIAGALDPPINTTIGEIDTFPPSLLRNADCHPVHARSKTWVRPPNVTTQSVHLVTSGTGNERVYLPKDGLWLLHLSDHPDASDFVLPLDFSFVSGAIKTNLADRYAQTPRAPPLAESFMKYALYN